MLGNLFGAREQETEEHWVSISDVMAGLMVIFLFIAISYMLNERLKSQELNTKTEELKAKKEELEASIEVDRIKTNEIIVYKRDIENLLDAYKNLQADLSEDLQAEFEGNNRKRTQFRNVWHGHLDMETLSIRFKKPFTQGSATVPNDFKSVLRNFFPRYVAILTKPQYRNEIAEIRIEGHTSSEWFSGVTGDTAYMNNMELSQNRARNVLSYALRMGHPEVVKNREWLKKELTANGLSSSQLVMDLRTNRRYPANLYRTVSVEVGIPERRIRDLHSHVIREIRNWRSSRQITHENILIGVARSFSDFQIESLQRAVRLLMENKEDSRRVEFRVVTKSEKLIDEIEKLMERFNRTR